MTKTAAELRTKLANFGAVDRTRSVEPSTRAKVGAAAKTFAAEATQLISDAISNAIARGEIPYRRVSWESEPHTTEIRNSARRVELPGVFQSALAKAPSAGVPTKVMQRAMSDELARSLKALGLELFDLLPAMTDLDASGNPAVHLPSAVVRDPEFSRMMQEKSPLQQRWVDERDFEYHGGF